MPFSVPVSDAGILAVIGLDPSSDAITSFTDDAQIVVDVVYDYTPNVAVPAPPVGHSLPALLAVGGILFGITLLERSK